MIYNSNDCFKKLKKFGFSIPHYVTLQHRTYGDNVRTFVPI